MLNQIERIKSTNHQQSQGDFYISTGRQKLKNKLRKGNIPSEEAICNLDIKAAVQEDFENVTEVVKKLGIYANDNDWIYMQVLVLRRPSNIEVANKTKDKEKEIDQNIVTTDHINNENDIVNERDF